MGKIIIDRKNVLRRKRRKMGRLDRVKDFFRNIFGKRKQKLLESGEGTKIMSSSSENRDLLQEKKDDFDARVQVELGQEQPEVWKDPEYGVATFLYKGKKLPASIWLNDIVTLDNVEYLEGNEYSIKMDDLSPKDTYKLTAQLIERTDSTVRGIVDETPEQHTYELSRHKQKNEAKLAEYFMEIGEPQKAIEKLDELLLSQLDYYDELMKKDIGRTDEDLDK